jgi:DNA-binding LacI/PurR family transcriptional regulator
VGARAVEMILKLLKGEKVESMTLVPELIERESAGPCRTT